MSEKLAQIKKTGGGALTETVLWTNPSPTASSTGGTITLSQSYRNFDFIKIVYALNSGATSNTTEVWVPTSVFSSIGYVGQAGTLRLVLGSSTSAGQGGCRYVAPASDTSIKFSQWYAINSSTENSNMSIIEQICGVK